MHLHALYRNDLISVGDDLVPRGVAYFDDIEVTVVNLLL